MSDAKKLCLVHVVLAGVSRGFIATSAKSHASSHSHLRALGLGTGNMPQTRCPWCTGSDGIGALCSGSGTGQELAMGTNSDSQKCHLLWLPLCQIAHTGKACSAATGRDSKPQLGPNHETQTGPSACCEILGLYHNLQGDLYLGKCFWFIKNRW